MTIANRPLTTAIGSLPHPNVDSALQCAFSVDIPFLPQIPMRHPGEFMLSQALDGLPGLTVDSQGFAGLDINLWSHRTREFSTQLEKALTTGNLEAFEPSPDTSSCWVPFLWELEERSAKLAKIQIAGPLTCQWALKLNGGTLEQNPEISSQIYRLVIARSLAMVRKLVRSGIEPIVYLDEPGLYALTPNHPKHIVALQELKILIRTLRKEGAIVGLHCCSNTAWNAVLDLDLQILSLDTDLSLDHLLSQPAGLIAGEQATTGSRLNAFILSGGRLSLGVIPTDPAGAAGRATPKATAGERLAAVYEKFQAAEDLSQEALARILSQAIYTPACGLALHSVESADRVLDQLRELGELARVSVEKPQQGVPQFH